MGIAAECHHIDDEKEPEEMTNGMRKISPLALSLLSYGPAYVIILM